ncbi:MAG: hypothetical protein LH472_01060, partial [Pyrinomonadaceae bacterium]|nr:hypothetical protein [Pyrinomonadaceae bacterium]
IVVPYDIPRRQAATYFPETNVLVPIGSVADKSHTPVSKFVIITIAPTTETAGKFDYEYVDGHARAAQVAMTRKSAKAGVFSRVNLRSVVGMATVAVIVGGTIRALCGKP